MRAGPLSDDQVITLLNHYFVPVYVSNEDYQQDGSAPADEKAEYHRIFGEFYKLKCSVGTVHVYMLDPNGHAMDSLHVAVAAQKDHLLNLLQATTRKLGTREGQPLVRPSVQSLPPKSAPDSLILHLTSRADGTGPQGGSWKEFPAENWIVLNRPQWSQLIGSPKVGASWEIDPGVASSLLRYFYPQTEDPSTSTAMNNRIDHESLKATVISVHKGTARVRITGDLRMKHTFYPGKEDNNYVDATVAGYLDFDPAKHQVQSLQLVTDKATYGTGGFAVAVKLSRVD